MKQFHALFLKSALGALFFLALAHFVGIPAAQAGPPVAGRDVLRDARNILEGSATNVFGSTAGAGDLSVAIGVYINTVVGFLGMAAVVLIVYAGALWLTAAGNDTKVETAKKILQSTVVGVIVVGLAYGITTFVINAVSRTS